MCCHVRVKLHRQRLTKLHNGWQVLHITCTALAAHGSSEQLQQSGGQSYRHWSSAPGLHHLLALGVGYEWQLVRSSEKGLPARSLSSASLASAPASDMGTDGPHTSAGQQPRMQSRTAGDAERLRTSLRQKEDQIASLQSQLTNIEATRDR